MTSKALILNTLIHLHGGIIMPITATDHQKPQSGKTKLTHFKPVKSEETRSVILIR